jgi:hypothetical protein
MDKKKYDYSDRGRYEFIVHVLLIFIFAFCQLLAFLIGRNDRNDKNDRNDRSYESNYAQKNFGTDAKSISSSQV